jgi:phage terminase large subunit-like protein
MTDNKEEEHQTPEEKLKLEILELMGKKEEYLRYHKMENIFPDTGIFARELYPKHLEFMDAGSKYRQRAIIAANRTGKTLMGAYEMTLHLTGLYPHWWKGKTFHKPIEAWAASVNNQTTKDVMQKELVGKINDMGSGMIPKDLIGSTSRKSGVVDALETVYVKHVSGGWSEITFKSYEQGRDAFQGTKKQVIWLDEEPKDPSIYTECLTRTMDKFDPGSIYCTFTPLFGLSDVVLTFLDGGRFPEGGVSPSNPHKFVVNVTWDDVPHLSEEQKEEILASYSKHERAARSEGVPSLGSGAIYPFLEKDITCPRTEIHPWWPRAYGFDVGWRRTAAIWGAVNPDTGVVYLYSEHYMGEVAPAIHASAIKARGEWIQGVIDPGSHGSSQASGEQLFDLYEAEGLHIENATNDVEPGIMRVYQMFETGQLKIMDDLYNTLSEIRVYRRDEKGKIVKKNDHLMDALRYICGSLDMFS